MITCPECDYTEYYINYSKSKMVPTKNYNVYRLVCLDCFHKWDEEIDDYYDGDVDGC